MRSFLLLLQLLSAIALVATILLHSAKGEGLGGIGGSAKLFGAQKGLEQGLNRITALCAVAFIIISVILAITSA
jgi:preprotein translocase subunit SecG